MEHYQIYKQLEDIFQDNCTEGQYSITILVAIVLLSKIILKYCKTDWRIPLMTIAPRDNIICEIVKNI